MSEYILTDIRGIGFAVTKSLLNEHAARVVALSRSKPPSLEQLEAQHADALLCIQCDVQVPPIVHG